MAKKRKRSVESKIQGREVKGGVLREEVIEATQTITIAEVKSSLLFTLGAVLVVAALFVLSSEFQAVADLRENLNLPKLF